MLSKYKYVLFDLDGTIIDSAHSIISASKYALNAMGKPVPSEEVLRKFVGPPLMDSFTGFIGMTIEEARQAVNAYRVYYNELGGIFDCTVYDGIESVFKSLKADGRVLAVATTKPERASVRILEHFGLTGYFDFIAGDTDEGTRSAKSDVIAYCLKGLGEPNKSEVIMIGDREHDIIGANKNDVDSIGVLYGCGTREELINAGANYIAVTPEDILEIGNEL